MGSGAMSGAANCSIIGAGGVLTATIGQTEGIGVIAMGFTGGVGAGVIGFAMSLAIREPRDLLA
jgi:hypothetical protein